MKFSKYLLATCSLMIGAVGISQARVLYSQNLVNETGLAYNNTYTLDMGSSILPFSNIDSLAMQAVYSSATISAVTFTDGAKSTGTITIGSFSGLVGAQATNTLTVSSNTFLLTAAGLKFTLNGIDFINGDLWAVGVSSLTTASNIVTAINTYGATSGKFLASTASNGVVTITVISSGTVGNAYTLSTSTNAALTVGAATFSGGKNQAFFVINGNVLTQGVDFNALTSSAVTGSNLAAAINTNAGTSAIIVASTNASQPGLIITTSTAIGANTNYGWFSSSFNALSGSNNRLFGGADSAISVATDKITSAVHGFTTGLPVLLTKTAGTIPTGLVVNTTYYAIRSDANSFQLATTPTGAIAGSAVNITAITGSGSFTLTPLAYTGTASFKWQSSNDAANWSDVSVSSVTMTSAAVASTLWDFGSINYRYMRLNFVAPTTGGVSLTINGIGKTRE